MGTPFPPCSGDHLFRDLCADLSLCGFCCGGATGGDQLSLPALEASAPHGQPGQGHILPSQQHDQPGHVCGVSHQHSGLDDPLAGAEPRPHPSAQLHRRQCRSGHHDRHEHRALLPPHEERLHEGQPREGTEEREREGERHVGKALLVLQLQPNPPSTTAFPHFRDPNFPLKLLTSFLLIVHLMLDLKLCRDVLPWLSLLVYRCIRNNPSHLFTDANLCTITSA